MIECNKWQSHKSFIPVNEFCGEHLPDSLGHDAQTLDFVSCMVDLTVRIRVNPQSSQSKNIFKQSKSASKPRTGTGWISFISENGERGDCPCHHPSKPPSLRRWWRMSIVTANHVVYDSEEAKSTQIDFFYDENSKEKNDAIDKKRGNVCNHVRLMYVDHDCDLTILTCVTHDRNIYKQIKKALEQVTERTSRMTEQPRTGQWNWGLVDLTRITSLFVKRKSEQKSRPLDSTAVLIVSHPHGLPKRISIGTLKGKYSMKGTSLRHKNSCSLITEGANQSNEEDRFLTYYKTCNQSQEKQCLESSFDSLASTKVEILWRPVYTAATCPGSSGAPVFIMPSTGSSRGKKHVSIRKKHRNFSSGISDRHSQLFYTHGSWISGQNELKDIFSLESLAVSLKDLEKEADMDNVSIEVWFPKGEKKMCEIHFNVLKVKEEKERLLKLGAENYGPPENYCLVLSSTQDGHQDIPMIDDEQILLYMDNIADDSVLKFVKTGDLDFEIGAAPLGITLKN